MKLISNSRFFRILLTVSCFVLIGCGGRSSQDGNRDLTPIPNTEDTVLEIELDTDVTFQTVHNFGASDAWSTQFVGDFWSEANKNEIAKLLFSTSNKTDGSPEGIGLTAWRFNIGGGSTAQGEASQITDAWRRAACFLSADKTYDWTKQSGQLWFLKEAKNRGVNTFIGFVNSPPVVYTKNGKAFSSDGLSSNLLEAHYKDYANFLSKVVTGVANKTGVVFDYISPFNEPQWEWKCCGQEGSPWNNREIFDVVKEIDNAFTRDGISSKIEITEAGNIKYLYKNSGLPNSGNQIEAFFNPNSDTYVGDLNTVGHKIAGHSYFSTWDLNSLINSRTQLDEKINSVDASLEYWMTEYTILEDNKQIKGNGRDLGMNPALYMARVIHSDLVFANASAWHWWLAISPYDYKDGLIYIDNNKFGGNYYESKMLWALGHYSRFIKPEMKRIATTRSDNKSNKDTIEGVLHSAYTSDNEIVVVFANQFNYSKTVKFSGIPEGYETIELYRTTETSTVNLQKVSRAVNINEEFVLSKRSLLTCVLRK